MNKLTFDEIRKRGLLLFEYVRGSKLYHTDTPESDEDHGGVFIAPQDFSLEIEEEVSDERNDTKWWELGKFMRLAMTSNPSVLEAFFVPDDLVIYEHPMFKKIRARRDEFVTKACFKPFGSYAVSQISKAQGQNKKIHWDMENMERKTPLDFCYTYDGRQGSVSIQEWLDVHGMRQDCCGLVNLTNMKGCYLVYYDFGQHFRLAGTDFTSEREKDTPMYRFMVRHFEKRWERDGRGSLDDYIAMATAAPLGDHCGIINNDGTSNTVRLCSTQRDEEPVCMMAYNIDGYGAHCRQYKEYMEWKTKRNKARYESNMKAEKGDDPDMKYDCKNMYHSFRMVAMCTEIAQGKGIILDRSGIDRDFLMDVRNRKFGYKELMNRLTVMTGEMEAACSASTIPDNINEDLVRNMVSGFRKMFFEMRRRETEVMKEAVVDEYWARRTSRMTLVLGQLLASLGIVPADVMLTGSLALRRHGMLPKGRGVHDIDVVVRADAETERDICALTRMCGVSTLWKVPERRMAGITHKPYIFDKDGVRFNIWVQDPGVEFDTEIVTHEGYKLATVKHILDAKKMLGRPKDMADMASVAAEVLGGSRNGVSGTDDSSY